MGGDRGRLFSVRDLSVWFCLGGKGGAYLRSEFFNLNQAVRAFIATISPSVAPA